MNPPWLTISDLPVSALLERIGQSPGGRIQSTLANTSKPEWTLPNMGAMGTPAVFGSLGADPAKVLAEAGFELELFDEPDNLVNPRTR